MKKIRRITCIELKYPYAKPRVFQSGSLIAIAARLHIMGFEVSIVDFNIHDELSGIAQKSILNTDCICISMTGTPYVVDAISFAKRMTVLGIPVLFGGQGAESLSEKQFSKLFAGTSAVRIATESDLLVALEIHESFPTVFQIGYRTAWRLLDTKSIQEYLTHEITLVISQGCLFRCTFCAAKKERPEVFRGVLQFEADLRHIAQEAKKRGIGRLMFYASSLDFFQSALVDKGEIRIEIFLKAMARVRKDTGVDIQTRCLSTLTSFLKASERIPHLGELLKEAGLCRIGFGVDGSDPSIWKSQNKTQNKPHQVIDCIETTSRFGVCAEILMVVGFPQDTLRTLAMNVQSAFRYAKYPNVILRAYMAKVVAPGNDGWNEDSAQPFVADPSRFQQIDYCAFASKITHPRLWHRILSNICYAMLMLIFVSSKRSVTYPVFPIRGNWVQKKFARFLNNRMPGVD